MFNIVFTAMVMIFSAMHSLQAMELVSALTLPQRKVSSLKNLCVNAVVRHMQSSEGIDQFARGETKYHLLPSDLQGKISAKLPARPRIQSIIKNDPEVDIVTFNFHPTENVCVAIDSHGYLSVIDIDSGEDKVVRQIWPDDMAIRAFIRCSADGRSFLTTTSFVGTDWLLGSFNDFSLQKIQCEDGEFGVGGGVQFSPTGKELIITKHIGVMDSLFCIELGQREYQGVRDLQFSSNGRQLLVHQQSEIIYIIDMVDEKGWFLSKCDVSQLSPDGNTVYRFLYNGNDELFDCVSGRHLILDGAGIQYRRCSFDPSGKYFLHYHSNVIDVWNLHSYTKECQFFNDGYKVIFILGGKYLWPYERNDCLSKINAAIAIEDAIEMSKRCSDNLSVDELFSGEKIIKFDYVCDCIFNLCSPDNKHVFLPNYHGITQLIDVDANKSILSLKNVMERGKSLGLSDYSWCFSPKGDKLFVSFQGGNNETISKVFRLDNDLTINQFLLKELIIAHKMTKEQVKQNEYLYEIYNSLSLEQKEYFDDYVFGNLKN